MPKVTIINIPMVYHCVLHVQSMSLTSVASTVLIHCITMFVTKAFNLDCPCMTYIITSVIIRVISATVNRSMSAKKLFRNLVEAWFSLEQYIGLKEDKLSSTTVDFIRSDGNLETKCLYWFRKPKMC